MNIIETAKYFEVSGALVYKWIKNKDIDFEIKDGHYFISPDAKRPKKRPPGPKVGE